MLHSLTNNFVKETKAKQINGFHNYLMSITQYDRDANCHHSLQENSNICNKQTNGAIEQEQEQQTCCVVCRKSESEITD